MEKYSDKKLLDETKIARRKEKESTLLVLKHLREIDRRRLYLDFNFLTLNEYCMKVLDYSSGEAYYRVSAMKLMRGSEVIEEKIESGELSLTSAVVVSDHLGNLSRAASTKEKEEVVSKVLGKSVREAKEILGQKVGEKINKTLDQKVGDETSITLDQKVGEKTSKILGQKVGEKTNKILGQKIEETTRNITVIDELVDKLKVLCGEAELEKILKNQIEKIINRKARKFTEKNSRFVPQSVKRGVRVRAQGKCEHVDMLGEKCGSKVKLEFDHIQPFALGGLNGKDNIRLLCRKHNQRLGIKVFGVEKICRLEGKSRRSS